MAKKIEWQGNTTCDFCRKECEGDLYDGMTGFGPWAVMCNFCFHEYGVGTGKGLGQHYKQTEDGRWEKAEG